MLTAHPDEAAVNEWRRRIVAGWGTGTHSHTLAAVEPIVLRLLDGTREPDEALTEIGRRCASDGHAFADVAAWLTILVEVAPRRMRRRLESRAAAEALAKGWAEAALDLRPAFRRLAPVTVLQLRLRELADQCTSLGLSLGEHYVIAVLDVDTGAIGPDARRSVLRLVADAAQQSFRAGETIAAAHSGRILVLAPRHRELAALVHGIVTDIQSRPEVAAHRVQGWIEPLPRDRRHADELVADLAR